MTRSRAHGRTYWPRVLAGFWSVLLALPMAAQAQPYSVQITIDDLNGAPVSFSAPLVNIPNTDFYTNFNIVPPTIAGRWTVPQLFWVVNAQIVPGNIISLSVAANLENLDPGASAIDFNEFHVDFEVTGLPTFAATTVSGASVVGATAGNFDTTLSTLSGDSLYSARLDGVEVETLHDDPTSIVLDLPAVGSGNVSSNFSGLSGGPFGGTAAIGWDFRLTGQGANQQATFNSNLTIQVAVPEVSTMAMCGVGMLAAVMVSVRRRSLGS